MKHEWNMNEIEWTIYSLSTVYRSNWVNQPRQLSWINQGLNRNSKRCWDLQTFPTLPSSKPVQTLRTSQIIWILLLQRIHQPFFGSFPQGILKWVEKKQEQRREPSTDPNNTKSKPEHLQMELKPLLFVWKSVNHYGPRLPNCQTSSLCRPTPNLGFPVFAWFLQFTAWNA